MTFKNICRYIVLAQIASDGGKDIYDLKYFSPENWLKGYPAKDKAIANAIRIIDSAPYCGINYYIAKGDEKAPVIIYFNIKTDRGYKQVSFHCFNKAFVKMIGKGQRTSWRYATASRENCKFLIDHYGLLKEQGEPATTTRERRERSPKKINLNARRKRH